MIQRLLDVQVQNMSRRSFLRTASVVGGTMAAVGHIGFTSAQDGTPVDTMTEEAPFAGPVDVLNYALTLEHLETAFYRDGLATIGEAGITGLGFQSGVFAKLSEIGAHEAEHVAVLTQIITDLGGKPVAEATYDFGYTDAAGFLQVAQALEDTGVAAYQGAAQYAMADDGLLTAALTIHGVEARHAAYVAVLNGGNPFPEAFNPTLTPAEVLDIAGPFIVD
jgi:hypothetical protein